MSGLEISVKKGRRWGRPGIHPSGVCRYARLPPASPSLGRMSRIRAQTGPTAASVPGSFGSRQYAADDWKPEGTPRRCGISPAES